MLQTNIFVKIFSFFMVLSLTVKCRRYNIEEEAMKLYKEPLNIVLARFRRTPDYLKILQDKAQDLQEYVHDISMQILFYYNQRIPIRISELMGIDAQKEETIKSHKPVYYQRSLSDARRVEEFLQPDLQTLNEVSFRRTGDDDNPGVRKLDHYSKLFSTLTLHQRNSMRNLGFEIAGNVIHTLIKSLAAPDDLVKSTRQPGGGYTSQEATTEHVSVHSVTGDGAVSSSPSKHSTDSKHRFRYRPTDKTI